MKHQINFVLKRLEKVGQISYIYAIDHFILRLGGVIYRIRAMGYKVIGSYEMRKVRLTKNYVYRLVK